MEWGHLPLDAIGQSLALLHKELDRKCFIFCIPDQGLSHQSSTVGQPRVTQDSGVAGCQEILSQGSGRLTLLLGVVCWHSLLSLPLCASEGVGQRSLHPTMLGCCQRAMFTDFSSSKVLNKKLLSCRLHRPERVWPLQRSQVTSSSLKGVLLKTIILVSFWLFSSSSEKVHIWQNWKSWSLVQKLRDWSGGFSSPLSSAPGKNLGCYSPRRRGKHGYLTSPLCLLPGFLPASPRVLLLYLAEWTWESGA